jgi:hypothetical protein
MLQGGSVDEVITANSLKRKIGSGLGFFHAKDN